MKKGFESNVNELINASVRRFQTVLDALDFDETDLVFNNYKILSTSEILKWPPYNKSRYKRKLLNGGQGIKKVTIYLITKEL